MASGATTVTHEGTVIPSGAGSDAQDLYVQTKALDLAGPNLPIGHLQKYVDAIKFDITGVLTNTKARVGYKDYLKDDFTYETYSLIDEDAIIEVRITARFFEIRVSDVQPQERWFWSGLEFYGTPLEGRL